MITLTRSTKNRDICFDKDIRASNLIDGYWPEMLQYIRLVLPAPTGPEEVAAELPDGVEDSFYGH